MSADALSRAPHFPAPKEDEAEGDTVVLRTTVEYPITELLDLGSLPSVDEEFSDSQKRDPEFKLILYSIIWQMVCWTGKKMLNYSSFRHNCTT